MSRLGAGRDRLITAGLGTRGAITQGEDVRVACGLQALVHHQLIAVVGLQAVQVAEKLRCLDTRGPDLHVRRDKPAPGGIQALGCGADHLFAGKHLDAEAAQLLPSRRRDPRRQRRKNPVRGLDDGYFHIAFRCDAVQAIGDELAGGVVKLRRQLHTGGTGPDDGYVQLSFVDGIRLGVGVEIISQQLLMKSVRLIAAVEKHAVFLDTFGAEVVGDAANGDDQGIVAKRAPRNDLVTLLIQCRRHNHLVLGAVQPAHVAEAKTKVTPASQGEIINIIIVGVQRPGGHGMQQRFPDMGQRHVDEGDLGLALFAQLVTKSGGEFQAAGPAADDDDMMSALRLLHVDVLTKNPEQVHA